MLAAGAGHVQRSDPVEHGGLFGQVDFYKPLKFVF